MLFAAFMVFVPLFLWFWLTDFVKLRDRWNKRITLLSQPFKQWKRIVLASLALLAFIGLWLWQPVSARWIAPLFLVFLFILYGQTIKDTVRDARPEKQFLFLALVFGLLVVIIAPPLHLFDEPEHYARAFSTARFSYAHGGLPHEFQTFAERIHRTNVPPFATSNPITDMLREPANWCFSDTSVSIKNANYNPLGYIPAATGIWVSWGLNLNILASMYLARFFGLLSYIFIVYFAIKIMPVYKRTFFIFALMPLGLQTAATITNDSITIAGCMLFVAIIARIIYQPEKASGAQIALLVAAAGIILITKYVYAPMLLAFFFIPRDKLFDNNKRYALFITSAAVFFVGLLFSSFWINLVDLMETTGDFRGPYGINNDEQIAFILSNPRAIASMIYGTFIRQIPHLRMQSSAVNSTPLAFDRTAMLVPTLFITYFALDAKKASLPKLGQATVSLGIVALMIVLCILPLYITFTPVGAPYAQGVQGRYLLPIIAFFPLLFTRFRDGHQPMSKRESMTVPFTVSFILLYLMTAKMIFLFL